MKRLHLLYLGLLVAAALGLVLWSHAGGRPAGPSAARGPAGTPPVARPEPRQRLRLTGHVLDTDGAPVAGATVFVMPKDRPGGIRDDLPHEVSDAEGRWSLQVKRVFGCWVGVVAPGYRNAYLDGDGVDPQVQVLLVVERAPALRVRLLDPEGRAIARKGVQLDPWPPQTCFFLPGPTCRQGEQWAVSDGRGELVFRVASDGPVVLTPHVEGYHASGQATWLARAEGEVTISLEANASLHLRLADAAGAPVRGLANVEFADPATGRLVLSSTESPDAEGLLRLERILPPGAYDVAIVVEGHARALLPALDLSDVGRPALVSLSLDPAPAEATLHLRLPPQTETIATASGRRRLRAPLAFFRRCDPGVRVAPWTPGAPERWDAQHGDLVFALEPARYDVLVADVLTGLAARLDDVGLEPGATLEVEAALVPGLRFPVRDTVGDGSTTRGLEVRDAAGRPLPVYGLTGDGRRRLSRDVDVLGGLTEGGDVRLGPYPGEAVTLRSLAWDGATKESVLPAPPQGD